MTKSVNQNVSSASASTPNHMQNAWLYVAGSIVDISRDGTYGKFNKVLKEMLRNGFSSEVSERQRNKIGRMSLGDIESRIATISVQERFLNSLDNRRETKLADAEDQIAASKIILKIKKYLSNSKLLLSVAKAAEQLEPRNALKRRFGSSRVFNIPGTTIQSGEVDRLIEDAREQVRAEDLDERIFNLKSELITERIAALRSSTSSKRGR